MRDFQKNKLYSWEDVYIKPLDKSSVSYENAQSIVDYIWNDLGYSYPPRIVEKHKNNTTALAKASRTKIFIREDIPTWVLIHELAHSLTSDHEGYSNFHNEDFLGIYINLLDRYIPNLNKIMLCALADKHGLKYNLFYSPHVETD